MEQSIKRWNEINPRYVQINFTDDYRHLTCVAEKLGFEFDASHYSENGEISMVYFTPTMREQGLAEIDDVSLGSDKVRSQKPFYLRGSHYDPDPTMGAVSEEQR